jgi:hypothetical protein
MKILKYLRNKLFGNLVVFWLKREMGHTMLKPAENIQDTFYIGYLFTDKAFDGGGYVESLDGKVKVGVTLLAKIQPL